MAPPAPERRLGADWPAAELLTVDEVAARLRVTVPTLRWLRTEGRFAPAIKVGRRLLWSVQDIDRWISAQCECDPPR